MKKLTLKFREIFQRYEYDTLCIHELLDVILEMMNIVDVDDIQNNIKKLSSFIKTISSNFYQSISAIQLIDNLYETEILPILLNFDHKYESLDSNDPDKELQKNSICNMSEERICMDKPQIRRDINQLILPHNVQIYNIIENKRLNNLVPRVYGTNNKGHPVLS